MVDCFVFPILDSNICDQYVTIKAIERLSNDVFFNSITAGPIFVAFFVDNIVIGRKSTEPVELET